jgi:hypothetical protein
MSYTRISREDLFSLVDRRREAMRLYLQWALASERQAQEENMPQWSMRMENRIDIHDAAEAAEMFPEPWWGLVVFTCFGSRRGSEAAAAHFQHALPPTEADAILRRISFPRGSVGHHRIQSTLKGAKQALVSACAFDSFFEEVLHSDDDFDARYQRLRAARMRQWGRTTCFDLLLRAGVLRIGGTPVLPEYAYFGGSTGPRKGFTAVFGVPLTNANAAWAEQILRAWLDDWAEVAERVGVNWPGDPLHPRDQENFLCIYQEGRSGD